MGMNTKQIAFGFEPAPYKSAKVLFLERMGALLRGTTSKRSFVLVTRQSKAARREAGLLFLWR